MTYLSLILFIFYRFFTCFDFICCWILINLIRFEMHDDRIAELHIAQEDDGAISPWYKVGP